MGHLDRVERNPTEPRFHIPFKPIAYRVVPVPESAIGLSWPVHTWISAFLFDNSEVAVVSLPFRPESSIKLSLPRIGKLSVPY